MKGLFAGQFKDLITIQQKSSTRSGIGEENVSWNDLATVWANVEPLRGSELFAAAQMLDIVDYTITIRYRTDITRDMRINFNGLKMDIISVINVKGNNINLELLCATGIRNARV